MTACIWSVNSMWFWRNAQAFRVADKVVPHPAWMVRDIILSA